MKIILIEDDVEHAKILEKELRKLGVDVIGPFVESSTAIEGFKEKVPDLVISALNLKDSPLDGVEIVQAFKRERDLPVIFLSHKENKSTLDRAKSIRPNYLLARPTTSNKLDVAIDFAWFTFMENNHHDYLNNEGNRFSDSLMNFFFVKQNGRYIRIPSNEIIYLKGAGSQTELFLPNSKYVVSSHLGDVISQIDIDTIFQCHRSFAVNLYAILSFDHSSIYVKNHDKPMEIPISDSYRKNVFDKIKILKSK
ncbi:MAG: response regulator transcription factor [Lewinellaceae bacterium]|nr:response regulator transcription factor [Lewinellaceae bacterium]